MNGFDLEEYYKERYKKLIKDLQEQEQKMWDRYFDSLENPEKYGKYNGFLKLIDDENTKELE